VFVKFLVHYLDLNVFWISPACLAAGRDFKLQFFLCLASPWSVFATCALNSNHDPPGILCRPGQKSRSQAVNNKPGSAQKRVGFLIPRETARKFCALIARRHIIPNQNPKFRNPKLHIWHPKPETRQSQQRSAGFHASGRERARFEGSLQPQKILALVKGVADIAWISESSRINKILAKIRF
jgi:hypothetical protein